MSEHPSELRVTLGAEPGARLDKALAAAVPEALALSRSRLQALIAEGAVARPDGVVLDDPRAKLAPGTEVVVTLPAPRPIRAAAEAIPLDIVYEDADLIVIDKPAGLVVHPAPGAPDGTLVNALLHHCGGSLSGIGGRLRPGIVHRIDKDTSGLLVVAKSDAAHRGLARQFAAHDLERRYLAVTRGAPDPAAPRLAHLAGISWEPGGVLRIEGRIGRHPGDRKRMTVLSETGKPAVTRVRVLERFGAGETPAAALVECRLETGRTHQIRVHLAFAGHSLVGDAVYGHRRGVDLLGTFPRQALHAASLGFVHPVSGAAIRLDSPLPPDMQALLATLRGCNKPAVLNEV
jgi:23S rRNA pseudouridine1911/1915/1917 synthase